MKSPLVILFIFISLASAQPPFLKGLGIGGKAALLVIKNLCGSEPPVACTCRDDNENESENDDLADVDILMGPLPRCVPKSCICADGSEQPLPPLPNRILNKVQEVLDKIRAKIASKVTKVCDNGESPSVCECNNALIGELTLPTDDPINIATCQPTRYYTFFRS